MTLEISRGSNDTCVLVFSTSSRFNTYFFLHLCSHLELYLKICCQQEDVMAGEDSFTSDVDIAKSGL